jgi:hypothetical protein
MKLASAALVLCASCGNLPAPPASMPWLHGFRPAAAGDVASPSVTQRMSDLLQVEAEADYGGIELRADLTGDGGSETVLASYQLGLVVVDPEGRVLARAPGLPAAGSADELVSLAIGDGQLGAPVIVLAVQTGGHHDSTIALAIYRLEHGKTLKRLFLGPIEEHHGTETATGQLTFLPSALAYRAPGARSATTWWFDPRFRRYVASGAGEIESALYRQR